jgi:hypothetical protein
MANALQHEKNIPSNFMNTDVLSLDLWDDGNNPMMSRKTLNGSAE